MLYYKMKIKLSAKPFVNTPISSTGEIRKLKLVLLAIADKLDSIVTFFAAGMVPSGSNDHMHYVVKLTVLYVLFRKPNELPASLLAEVKALLNPMVQHMALISYIDVEVLDFFAARMKQYLSL